MTCPHCHAPNREDARFCGVCGKTMAATEPVSDPSSLRSHSSIDGLAAYAAGGEAPQLIGREIAGRYRVQAKLGEGGMGAVYRAEQISLKRTVAVKLLRPDMSASPLLLRRFNAEAELVAKLSHPNTVNIYDFGQDTDGTLFIAMEYIEGASLRSVIHAAAPLSPQRALGIAVQIAASLADAHAHAIVHRDLKPDNVMLQERGRVRDVVRVLDFGIAKLRDDSRATHAAMTQQGDMLGTPQYMAPEQIRAEAIDGRTDVYALGCMLYEMVTARLPFEGPTIMALLSKHLLEAPVPPSVRRPDLGLPPAIDQLVLSAMAKEAGARPPTMELYGEHIAAVLAMFPAEHGPSGQRSAQGAVVRADTPAAYSYAAAVPTPAPPYVTPPPPQALPPPRPPQKKWALLGALVVLGAGAIGAAVYMKTRPAEERAPDPTPAPDKPDPWEHKGSGDQRLVSPTGFALIVPPGYRGGVDKSGSITVQNDHQFYIGLGAVDSRDLGTLVAEHVKTTGLHETNRWTVSVNGETRPCVSFAGTVNGVEIEEVGVAYFGPSYQFVAILQNPVRQTGLSSDELDALRAEIFTSRVVPP